MQSVERVGLVISGDNAAAAVKTIVEAEAVGITTDMDESASLFA